MDDTFKQKIKEQISEKIDVLKDSLKRFEMQKTALSSIEQKSLEQEIDETVLKIGYLTAQLSKLESNEDQITPNFDDPITFWLDIPLSPQLICFKLKEIEYKHNVEKRIMERAEYIQEICNEERKGFFGKIKNIAKDFLTNPMAENKLEAARKKAVILLDTSNQKIRVLNIARKKYTLLETVLSSCLFSLDKNIQTSGKEKKDVLTGTLNIDVLTIESSVVANEACLVIDGMIVDRKSLVSSGKHTICTLRGDLCEAKDIELLFYMKNELKCMFFGKIEWVVKGKHQIALEPVGTIMANFKYTKIARKRGDGADLKRRNNLLEKVRLFNSHHFVYRRFFQLIIRCAVCSEYLILGGYRCNDCLFTCHEKCLKVKIGSCLKNRDPLSDGGFFEKPHNFNKTSVWFLLWCEHCGVGLDIGPTGSVKCQACKILVHEKCSHFVQKKCGKLRERQSSLSSMKKTTASLHKSTKQFLKSLFYGEDKTIEKYKILTLIGRGSFGRVFLAKDNEENIVAIKTISKSLIACKEEMESLIEEKTVLSCVTKTEHPFLLQMHTCFQDSYQVYFVLEYIGGGDLMHHIQQEMFTKQQARFYASQVVLALEFLHSKNIIYRDLKLDNILLSSDGFIKVADYGLCKTKMKYTEKTQTFCGTPEFIAPEIAKREAYQMAVDWWAFGVLLYEMLLGVPPFEGNDPNTILKSILETEPEYPDHLAENEKSLIVSLLKKNPAERIGFKKEDVEKIKSHPYFDGICFKSMLDKKYTPPITPKIKNKFDVSNFDSEFTEQKNVLFENQTDEVNEELFEELEKVLREQ